jgi:hypothetical protein
MTDLDRDLGEIFAFIAFGKIVFTILIGIIVVALLCGAYQ